MGRTSGADADAGRVGQPADDARSRPRPGSLDGGCEADARRGGGGVQGGEGQRREGPRHAERTVVSVLYSLPHALPAQLWPRGRSGAVTLDLGPATFDLGKGPLLRTKDAKV